MDYSQLSTPPKCQADFNLVPIGTGHASISQELEEVMRLLKTTGVKYTMHDTGTVVEGSWVDVMNAIGKAHSAVHQRGIARVQSTITVGTRSDKTE